MSEPTNEETQSAPPHDLIGRKLDDRYLVQQVIGRGGMGEVYLARQLRLNRPVALKVPRPGVLENRTFRTRFLREAHSMARIQHENICQIFDVSVSDDPKLPSYLVMEYVEGERFDNYVHKNIGKLKIGALLDILDGLANALDAAHNMNIIHRDIKPSNILIANDGTPKIMDFGVAQVPDDIYRTRAGVAIGTPAFMAPEQVQGKGIGPKSDQYAFGITLYYVFTGKVPFEADRNEQVAFQQINVKPKPPSEYNPNIPKAIEAHILRALEKDKGDRFPNCTAMVEAIKIKLGPHREQPAYILFPEASSLGAEPLEIEATGTDSFANKIQDWAARPLIGFSALGIILFLAVLIGYQSSGLNNVPQTPGLETAAFDGPRILAPDPDSETQPVERPSPLPLARTSANSDEPAHDSGENDTNQQNGSSDSVPDNNGGEPNEIPIAPADALAAAAPDTPQVADLDKNTNLNAGSAPQTVANLSAPPTNSGALEGNLVPLTPITAEGAAAASILTSSTPDNADYADFGGASNDGAVKVLEDDGAADVLDLAPPKPILGFDPADIPLDPLNDDPYFVEETLRDFIERDMPKIFRREDIHQWHRRTLRLKPVRRASAKGKVQTMFRAWDDIQCRTELADFQVEPDHVIAEFTMQIDAISADLKSGEPGAKQAIFRTQEPLRWRLESRGGEWYFSEMDENWLLNLKIPERHKIF